MQQRVGIVTDGVVVPANPSCGVTVRRALEKPKGKIPLLGPCPAMEQERLKWQYKHMDNACKATVRAEREAQREKDRKDKEACVACRGGGGVHSCPQRRGEDSDAIDDAQEDGAGTPSLIYPPCFDGHLTRVGDPVRCCRHD